jgi:hypothetical protein
MKVLVVSAGEAAHKSPDRVQQTVMQAICTRYPHKLHAPVLVYLTAL